MPNREQVMEEAREYLDVREKARIPPPIKSAIAVGMAFVISGFVALGIALFDYDRYWVIMRVCVLFVPLGIALIILGRQGVAKHRVTETTRYPQQTGEMADLYFQIIGEKYLWIVVALLILLVVSVAVTLSPG